MYIFFYCLQKDFKPPIYNIYSRGTLEAGKHYGEGIIKEYSRKITEELGKGYSKRNLWLMLDLLLYNIKYKCYVVTELKITELKKEHIGQIQVYINYINKNLKTIEEDKTIGIIICKKDNKYILEYCSDKRIHLRNISY